VDPHGLRTPCWGAMLCDGNATADSGAQHRVVTPNIGDAGVPVLCRGHLMRPSPFGIFREPPEGTRRSSPFAVHLLSVSAVYSGCALLVSKLHLIQDLFFRHISSG
jgi:hypothetical protein